MPPPKIVVKYQKKFMKVFPGKVLTLSAYAASAVTIRPNTIDNNVAETEISREVPMVGSSNAIW